MPVWLRKQTSGQFFHYARASSCKVYGAVPPPQQLLAGVQSSGNELNLKTSPSACSTSSSVSSTPTPLVPPLTVPGAATVFSQGAVTQCGGLFNPGQPQSNLVRYPPPSLTGGTSYSGYGGIYPQATPLQQVALALRQSPSPVASTMSPSTSTVSTVSKSSVASFSEKEKRQPQKRKFQESPVALKGPTQSQQVWMHFSLYFWLQASVSIIIYLFAFWNGVLKATFIFWVGWGKWKDNAENWLKLDYLIKLFLVWFILFLFT